jgi:hypothetical protein
LIFVVVGRLSALFLTLANAVLLVLACAKARDARNDELANMFGGSSLQNENIKEELHVVAKRLCAAASSYFTRSSTSEAVR